MKKLLLSLCLLCVASVTFAQDCCPYIDAVQLLPMNPTSDDAVQVVITVTTPNQGGVVGITHTVSADTIHIVACYFQGMLPALDTHVDTVTIGQLPAGYYQVLLTAQISESFEVCVPITSNDTLTTFEVSGGSGNCSMTLNVTNVSCNGLCDGAVGAIVNATLPYDMIWSNGAIGDMAFDLCPGEYGVTLTDANGCVTSSTAVISEPASLFTNASVIQHASCDSCLDGIAELNISGGAPPYQIMWSNNQTDSLIVYLNPGAYAYTVMDANGCQDTGVVMVDIINGTAAVAWESSVMLWPNPVQRTLTIEGINAYASIRLYATDGRLLQAIAPSANDSLWRFDVTGISQGIYVVEMVALSGNIVRLAFVKN